MNKLRAILWFTLITGVTLALAIGCEPVPVTAQSIPLFSYQGECNPRGVCCYETTASSSLSCVATRIEIIIRKDDEPEQRRESSEGKENRRVLKTSIIEGPWEDQ